MNWIIFHENSLEIGISHREFYKHDYKKKIFDFSSLQVATTLTLSNNVSLSKDDKTRDFGATIFDFVIKNFLLYFKKMA